MRERQAACSDATARHPADDSLHGSEFRVGNMHGGMHVYGSRPTVVTPRQLPAENPHFAGRMSDLAKLDTLLHEAQSGVGEISVAVLDGLAGVGKTTLAISWAHSAAAHFPDGQLYINLRGFDPSASPVDPADAVRAFLEVLGTAPELIPTGYMAQEALYRSILADRKVLIVLDNARSAEQVRPLLPGTPGCFVLITSRNELPALVTTNGARIIKLEPLDNAGAEAVFSAHIGKHRVAEDPGVIEELARICARLPLALSIVAAQAAVRPQFNLRALVEEVETESDKLDLLDLGEVELSIRAVFSWSYNALGTDDAARLFRMIGALSGPDIAVSAAASLIKVDRSTARRTLGELARANLVEEYVPGRYRLHDLLRIFAKERGEVEERSEQLAQAELRLLDHYLHTSFAADRLLDPARQPVCLQLALAGVFMPPLKSEEDALEWFELEHSNLVFAAERSFTSNRYAHTWQLAWAFNTYLYWRANWTEIASIQLLGVKAAKELKDKTAVLSALRGLGRALTRLGQYKQAEECLQEALELSINAQDDIGEATAHHALSFLYDTAGDYASALSHAEMAIPLWRARGNVAREARAINDLGWAHARLGRYSLALDECSESLGKFREIGNRHGEALALHNMAWISKELGNYANAIQYVTDEISVNHALANRYSEAQGLNLLGDTLAADGQIRQAAAAYSDAISLLEEEGRSEADVIAEKLLLLEQGQ
ncbi:ATP-binding protein [Mycolicibacterium peregrinum]|uniref:ATP-binding protein n=1 Tax=Mycolicibacterium peregrinum TaxID=43304 RepID=UPI003AB0B363